jgi:hypothetical protein
MSIRKQKKLFKKHNSFVKLLYIKSIHLNCLNLHKKYNKFKGVDKFLIRFDNRKLKQIK